MATAGFSSSLGTSSGATLQNRLTGLARRRNAQKMARALIRAAIPGVGLAALGVALYKLHIIPDGPVWAPFVLVGGCLLWGVRNGLAARGGSFDAACDADRTLNLDDHLSSALAFAAPDQVQRRTPIAATNSMLGRLSSRIMPRFSTSLSPAVAPTSLVPSLVDEAATRAQGLDARRVYPLRFDRQAQILAVLGVLLVGALLMPDYAIFQSAQERKQVAAMQVAGEKLVEVAKVVRKTAAPQAADEKRLAQRLQKLGQKMVRGRMTKRAALTEMGELRQQLKKAQQQKPTAQGASLPQIPEALRQAPLQSETGRKVQEKMAENKWEEAAKALEQLAEKIEKNQLSADEKQKAAQDLEKVARDLKSRGGQANQEAAKQLEAAAQQLKQPQQNQQQQQQGQNPQSGQQQQGDQQGQQQQGQKQGQQQQQNGQQGQNPDGKKPQEGQKAQSGNQQSQSEKSQSQSSAQQGQQQQQQGGQQGKSQQGGAQQGQGQEQGGQQDAASALRNMAKGLRPGASGGSNSQGLQDMLNKIRDAENMTGTNNGQQFGQVTPTEGECKGGDCRGLVTPGKDLRASDPYGAVNGGAGLGPRNNAQGSAPGGGVSKSKAARTGDKRRYADEWSSTLPKTRAQIDRLKGKWGGSGEVEQMPTKGESKGGQVRTPYYDVYESGKRDAQDAVNSERVPPEYKQPVKDYFESIKP